MRKDQQERITASIPVRTEIQTSFERTIRLRCHSNMPVQFVFFLLSSPLVSFRLQFPRPGPMGGKENPTSSHSSSRSPTGVQLHSAPTGPGTHSVDGSSE